MRWGIVLLAGLLGVSASVVGLLSARAQQFSPALAGAMPPAPRDEAAPESAAPDAAPDLDGAHRMQGWRRAAPPAWRDTFGLVFTPADRALSQADVQKVAEAWLLWHGNHAWHVTALSSDADRVNFAIATPDNAVIATFAMNRHTGTLARTG